jgi:hypothetical protein
MRGRRARVVVRNQTKGDDPGRRRGRSRTRARDMPSADHVRSGSRRPRPHQSVEAVGRLHANSVGCESPLGATIRVHGAWLAPVSEA